MPIITRALLRKRAEHNEGIISSLEEISLHQEELEGINEVLGTTCRKLKILYLQNNIIARMENLHHLKDLEYLNLALNNIAKIEGLQYVPSPSSSLSLSSHRNCEFLKKLDLTVNFVDLDELEESITHLQPRHHLKDLYMMGNPADSNWPNFRSYVIAMLPQLNNLDGTEITKSMRIIATQALPSLEVYPHRLPSIILPHLTVSSALRLSCEHWLQQNVQKRPQRGN
jgi:protein TilB